MVNLGAILVGPLAAPESRRALARGWVILVRWFAALAVMSVLLATVWWWWVVQQSEPYHQPYLELRGALAVVEAMLLIVALVMGPAVLAGSLAGEKERGVLALLLTTRATAREIVVGRVFGKLTQVGMAVMAGFPAVILLAALAGMRPGAILVLLVLPLGVALGGGGLAALASIISRRGRDALLAVYLLDLMFLLSPLAARLSPTAPMLGWLGAISPFAGVGDLAWYDATTLASLSLATWVLLGLGGIAFASWRLRPSCQALLGGAVGARRGSRRFFVPAVDERRPMLWKELFIERVGSLGRFGTWIGMFLVVGQVGLAVILTGVIIWSVRSGGGQTAAEWAREEMDSWIGGSGPIVAMLIQWAIGLRAAVSISSERERGTWDALMTSPLEPREIVGGKLWGSLYALRWLAVASFIAWVLAVATNSVPLGAVVLWMVQIVVIGAFMAAVGVRVSLDCPTATKAMSITIGTWLIATVLVSVVSGLTLATAALCLNLGWILFAQAGLAAPATTFWAPVPMAIAWPLTTNFVYVVTTIVIVADTRLRFDRLAGRMTGGAIAVAFDRMLYGENVAPIPVEPEPSEPDGTDGTAGSTAVELGRGS